MPRIETNDFAITNLSALKSRYKLYKITGLRPGSAEYYANRQHIIRKLSFGFQRPVTVIERNDAPYLVVSDDAPEPVSPMTGLRDARHKIRGPKKRRTHRASAGGGNGGRTRKPAAFDRLDQL